jgi:hypothetical protein
MQANAHDSRERWLYYSACVTNLLIRSLSKFFCFFFQEKKRGLGRAPQGFDLSLQQIRDTAWKSA